MKKTLVVLLALMMIFAFASIAQAADTQYVPYTDISNQSGDIQTAIDRLSVLGALKGYDATGTIFAPSQLITREEFAAVAVRVAGLDDQVSLYASLASAFKDVEEGRWSEGYINCANANGIMVGRGAGIFDPKSDVTMQEVVTVLLRAVGYDDRLPGSWPTDYNTKAVKVGLAKYVDFIGPKYATRADVASMTNEALDKGIVYYVANEIAQGIGMGMDWVDKDGYAYENFNTNQDDLAYSDLLYETYDAYVVPEVLFYDDSTGYEEDPYMSEGAAWDYQDYSDGQIYVYWSVDDLDTDSADDYQQPLADLYGISPYELNGELTQADLTDLGWQVADVTVYDTDDDFGYYPMILADDPNYDTNDEVAFIDINSTITRTDKAADDYTGWVYDSGTVPEKGYGEYWSYSFDNENFQSEDAIYAAKDFSDFEDWGYDVVDSADADYVTFKDDGPVMGSPRLDVADDNYTFYLIGTGFVSADALQENDVVYLDETMWDESADDYNVGFYLVFRPTEASLDDYGNDFITPADNEMGALPDSGYSIDKGATIEYYPPSFDDVTFSDKINWAPAYAFINFSYFWDAQQMNNYGVIESYIYDNASSHLRIADAAAQVDEEYIVTGMNVLLPGDTETTVLNLVDETTADDSSLPVEGSIASFTLNDEGDVISVDEYHGFNYYDCTADDIHSDDDVTGTWNSAQTRLTLDDGTPADGFSDVWTLADDASIYLVDINGADAPPAIQDLYKFGSVQCLTVDEFKALGDFNADDASIYDYSTHTISALYINNIDSHGTKDYGFGLFVYDTGNYGYSAASDSYWVKIDGVKVLNDGSLYDDLVSNASPCLVAYETNAGVVEDNYDTIYDRTDVANYYADFYDDDHLDYEIGIGRVEDYDGSVIDMSGVWGGEDATYMNEAYFYVGTSLIGFDFSESDAVDLDLMQDNIDAGTDYYSALFAYKTSGDNDMYYILLQSNASPYTGAYSYYFPSGAGLPW